MSLYCLLAGRAWVRVGLCTLSPGWGGAPGVRGTQPGDVGSVGTGQPGPLIRLTKHLSPGGLWRVVSGLKLAG